MTDLRLMTWLSPSFPVGSFAYSHGLEWAYDYGDVTDATSLKAWLLSLLLNGSARHDAVIYVCAHRAVSHADMSYLFEISELALALANSAERRLETVSQGNAFLLAIGAAWPCAALESFHQSWSGDVAYPVAVALACAGHQVPIHEALPAFLLGFMANLLSSAVRLGIIGQTDSQHITAGMLPHIEALSAELATATLDDLGGCVFRSDLAAIRHETQYSRLFRS